MQVHVLLPYVEVPEAFLVFCCSQAKLKYKTSVDDKYHMQEVQLHVKRSPAWQETQDVDTEVRELAATRKVFRVSGGLRNHACGHIL